MKEETKTQVVPRGSAQDAEGILADIGKNFRRVDATNRTDKAGLRAVWHQSKMRTDMVSWERKDRSIERQELCFFGKMVEFRDGNGLRTGDVPNGAEESDEIGPRIARSDVFKPARDLDLYVLDAASRILRACKRDYYTQHLLGHVNSALQKLEKQAMRTQVHGLDFFKEIEQAGRAMGNDPKQKSSMPIVWAIIGAAVVVAGGAFWFLFTRRA